ncbi:Gfo/Idh/MocA family protein [Solimonas terrae]|uniref:Gfo/Idh/MocA family oxidoreductase n=1 Tax=Solimonas terrae TaxID=1396819 RepID=A0A6M2BPJ6_9GAMM|nr:Gfo/Idh/MocA family oxidoreductase [Solimonas terrae]NGY03973.1 Gfo/Idh/MocA family oxidoreductase [Solimonas terrae]
MSARIPALVAGTGFGCRTHVPALRAAGFEVVGLVGADAERTARRAAKSGIAASYTDLDDAITKSGARVVSIATPPHTHAALAMTAIARGCHVTCEKPFTLDIAAAKAVLAAAERAGIVHLLGHEFRWGPDRALVAQAIREGRIGTPRLIGLLSYLPLLADPAAPMPDWWFDTAKGGGWLGAHGSHLIDQVRDWLGEFKTLSASLPTVSARDGGAEDTYVLRFTLENGVEGVLQQTAGAWGKPAAFARVAGTQGTLSVNGDVVTLADRDGERTLDLPPALQLPVVDGGAANPGLAAFTRLFETMHARIDGGPDPAPVRAPTFADGLKGMQVMAAVRASAAQNGACVSVDV